MAIGIGYGPMGQVLPDSNVWYDLNLPLINATLANKEKAYEENSMILDKIGEMKGKITPIPGTPDEKLANKIYEYIDSEADRISKLYSGDLSRASAELNQFKRSVNDLFSTNGWANKINKSYQNLVEGKKPLDKRKEEGKIKDFQYWHALESPLEEYKKEGVFAGTYTPGTVADYVDEDKLVKEFLDDWKPDTTVQGVTKSSDGKFYTITKGKVEQVPYGTLKVLAKDYLKGNEDIMKQREMMWKYDKSRGALSSYQNPDTGWKSIEEYVQPLTEEMQHYGINKNSPSAEILKTQMYINDKYGVGIAEDGKWGPETEAVVTSLGNAIKGKVEKYTNYKDAGLDAERVNYLDWLDSEFDRIADRWANKEAYTKDLTTYQVGIDPNYTHMLRLKEQREKINADFQLAKQVKIWEKELIDYERIKEDPTYGYGSGIDFVTNPQLGKSMDQVNQTVAGMKEQASNAMRAMHNPLFDAAKTRLKIANEPIRFSQQLNNEMKQVMKAKGFNGSVEEAFASGIFDNTKFKTLNGNTIQSVLGEQSTIYQDSKNATRSNLERYNVANLNLEEAKNNAVQALTPAEQALLQKPDAVIKWEQDIQPQYQQWVKSQNAKGNFTKTTMEDFVNYGPMKSVKVSQYSGLPKIETQLPGAVQEWYNKSNKVRKKVNDLAVESLTSRDKRQYVFYTPEIEEQRAVAEIMNRTGGLEGRWAIDPLDPENRVNVNEVLNTKVASDLDYEITGFKKSQSGIAGNGYVLEFNVNYKGKDKQGNNVSGTQKFYFPRSEFISKELTDLESSPAGIVERNINTVISNRFSKSTPITYEDMNSPIVMQPGTNDIATPTKTMQLSRNPSTGQYWWNEFNPDGSIATTYSFEEGKAKVIGAETSRQLLDEMNQLGIPRVAYSSTAGDFLVLPNTNYPLDIQKVYLDEIKDVYSNPNSDPREVTNRIGKYLVIDLPATEKEGRWVTDFILKEQIDPEIHEPVYRLSDDQLQQLLNITKTKYKYNQIYQSTTKSKVFRDASGNVIEAPTSRSTTEIIRE